MHDSSLDRVALSENLTFYMTTLRTANENIKHRNVALTISHIQNIHFPTTKVNDNDKKDSMKLLSER